MPLGHLILIKSSNRLQSKGNGAQSNFLCEKFLTLSTVNSKQISLIIAAQTGPNGCDVIYCLSTHGRLVLAKGVALLGLNPIEAQIHETPRPGC